MSLVDSRLAALGFKLPVYPYPLALVTSVALLILSEANRFYLGSAGFKVAASLSFLGAGIQAALSKVERTTWDALLQPENRSSAVIVVGLAFSVIGDVLLIPSPTSYAQKRTTSASTPESEGESPLFKAGTFFFALAHISYIAAFLLDSSLDAFRLPDFVLVLTFGAGLTYWLGVLQKALGPDSWFNVPQGMRDLVTAYVVIIMTMVATATATDAGHQKIVGAWTFMASDLFVAADVFGVKTIRKQDARGRQVWKVRSVGWVAYFGAQLLLAGCI